MKKILCALLALLMLLLPFASCAKQTESEGESTTASVAHTEEPGVEDPSLTQFDTARIPKADYSSLNENGTVHFLLQQPATDTVKFNEILTDVNNPDIINSALSDRQLYIESKYGVKLSSEFTVMKEFITLVDRSVMSGDNMYQVVMPGVTEAFSLALKGLTMEINTVDGQSQMGLENPWWNSNVLAETAILDKNFFAIGDMNINAYNSLGCLFLNVNLLNKLNKETMNDIYLAVKEGKWTFEMFHEIAKNASQDLDGLGFNEDDQYGAAMNSYGALCFTYGSGIKFVNRDSNDDLTLSVTGKFYDYFQKLVNFCADDTVVLYSDRAQYASQRTTLISEAFMEDRTLFVLGCLSYSSDLINYASDYGIVPMPKADEHQKGYSSFLHQYLSSTVCIPVTNSNDVEALGTILEDMTYYSYFLIRPMYIETVIKHRYLSDEGTGMMVDILIDSIQCDIALIHSATGGLSLITDLRKLLTAFNPNISSEIASKKPNYLSSLNAAVSAIRYHYT